MPSLIHRQSGQKPKVEIGEVVAYVHALEHRADHTARYRAHDMDERIWRLEKYTLEELKTLQPMGVDRQLWPSYTSNGPRTYWNAIRRATTANPPMFRIQLPSMIDADIEEFDEMLKETARHEHFAYGVWASVDEQRIRTGRIGFQDEMSFHMAIRGGVFIRPWFDPASPHYTPFSCPIWDPKTVAYEVGDYGLDFVSHHYFAPEYEILDKYGKLLKQEDIKRLGPDGEGNLEIYDCWWCDYSDEDYTGKPKIWNAVIASGSVCLMEKEYDDLDHLPVYLIPCFGVDVEPNTDYHYTIQRTLDKWESIYTTNKDVYPFINRVMTLYSLYLRAGAIGPWHAKMTGIPDDKLGAALRPFQLIQTNNPNASIDALNPPNMAGEVKELLTHLQGEEQRGSVAWSLFGQIPFQLSGFAVNQLQGSVSITAGQMTKQMGAGYRLATDELIQQFRRRGGGRVTLKGMDTRRQQFIEDISRSDLRDKYYLEVSISPELPVDKLQMAQVAQIWGQIGIDPITIADELLQIKDPRQLLKRMLAWRKIQAEEAKAAAEAEAAVQQQAQPPGQLPPGGEGPMNGIPPEMMPPEMNGIQSGFTPSLQQTGYEQLEGAGFLTP